MIRVLQGLKVVEQGTFITGPAAGMLLLRAFTDFLDVHLAKNKACRAQLLAVARDTVAIENRPVLCRGDRLIMTRGDHSRRLRRRRR